MLRLPSVADHSPYAQQQNMHGGEAQRRQQQQQYSSYSRAQSAMGTSRSLSHLSPYAQGSSYSNSRDRQLGRGDSHNYSSMPKLRTDPGSTYESPYAQRSRQSSRQGRRLKSRQKNRRRNRSEERTTSYGSLSQNSIYEGRRGRELVPRASTRQGARKKQQWI